MLKTKAVELIVENGRVTGVEAEIRKVVLAKPTMVLFWLLAVSANVQAETIIINVAGSYESKTTNRPEITGDGIWMAEKLEQT